MAKLGDVDDKGAVSFGPFELFPAARMLARDGVAVRLGGRALDILIVLVEHAGDVVSKRDLVAAVWSDVTVEEGSLRFHVAALRKALGDGLDGARYVTNVPGRGYCLVAPVSRRAPPGAAPVAPPPATLPARPASMVGREDTVRHIAEELAARRFVAVVGPGGIGKTTVAVAVAHALLTAFDGAVHFVDLGAVTDARLVPSALASVLGQPVHADDPVPGLLGVLKTRRLMLVLDNCEHVIDAVAPLAEAIFHAAPQVHILATSRESLRVEGERIHRLFPLECPPETPTLRAADVLAFPAAQLFVERAAAGLDGFRLSDADAPVVAQICRKLDGIALALELAAGRVSAFGIREIASLLDDRFALLWPGRRTAVPRHQTLSATLDWSYDLLSVRERTVMGRLAVFVGGFTLDAAVAVAADDDIDATEIVTMIADLVSKSLLSQAFGIEPMQYRLLDTTRAYLRGKPADGANGRATARRHAAYCRRCLVPADGAPAPSFAASRGFLGNLRAALAWCFAADGDRALGVDLAAAATPFLLDLSLVSECHRWSREALAGLGGEAVGSRREMALQGTLAISLMFAQGSTEDVRTAFERGLALAEALDDPAEQFRLLNGFQIFATRVGDFAGAVALSEHSQRVAARLDDGASRVVADWSLGAAQHLIGNQAAALPLCETAMTHGGGAQPAGAVRLGYDRRIIALVSLARALWLTGRADHAVTVARYTVEEAEAVDNPVTLCIALIYSSYVFLWRGDWPSAEAIVERLLGHAATYSLGPYQAVGLGLSGTLAIRTGDAEAGVRLIQGCLETLQASRHQILIMVLAGVLAEGLTLTGRLEAARAAIERAIAESGGPRETFHTPEMLRIKGDILARLPGVPHEEAEACLQDALQWARRQAALGWELRSATALARLWFADRRADAARKLLAPVYARFSEGFDTLDLRTARRLLDELGPAHYPGA